MPAIGRHYMVITTSQCVRISESEKSRIESVLAHHRDCRWLHVADLFGEEHIIFTAHVLMIQCADPALDAANQRYNRAHTAAVNELDPDGDEKSEAWQRA